MKKGLALFDFDGTITRADTFIDFIRYAVGTGRLVAGLIRLSPRILAYLAGVLPNDRLKAAFLTCFFKNWPRGRFEDTAGRYAAERLPRFIKASALERIRWHQENAHDVYVVSASFEDWLLPWCNSLSVRLIATRLEKEHDRITGKLLTLNCHGREKVRRIKAALRLEDYETIYAYGDSRGDRPMLALAQHQYYRHFR